MFEFSSNFPWHVQLQKRVCPSWQGRKERKKPFFTMPASVSESYNPYDKNTCNHTICNIRIQSNTATKVPAPARWFLGINGCNMYSIIASSCIYCILGVQSSTLGSCTLTGHHVSTGRRGVGARLGLLKSGPPSPTCVLQYRESR